MIELKSVIKKFSRLKALDDIDLRLERGHCIALIGPNGSGKTTLIKSILGMVVPESGDIFFNGESIRGNWEYREHIGYMPQIGRYPDNMTIGQVFHMMKDIRKKTLKREPDMELYEAFELEEIHRKRMSTLSGGTRQKVSASLAFLFNPDVLILDEPTAGLDPVASEKLKWKIDKEKEKGKLILITSHILSELDGLVSHVIYMQEGKIIFHKDIEKLKQQTGESRLSKVMANLIMAETE